MAGCRCPGRFPAATFAAAASAHGAHRAMVAAWNSTSSTSAVVSDAGGSWQMRTAPGCAFQSAGPQGTMPVPVEYPAAGPLGRWLMLARMASQTVTVVIVMGLLTAGAARGIRD